MRGHHKLRSLGGFTTYIAPRTVYEGTSQAEVSWWIFQSLVVKELRSVLVLQKSIKENLLLGRIYVLQRCYPRYDVLYVTA